MIFGTFDNRIYIKPIDLLGFAALSYLGSGIAYGFFVYDFVHDEAIWSFVGCMSGWLLFSRKNVSARVYLEITLRRRVQQKLVFLAYIGLTSMLIYFFVVGADYLVADKVERSESISNLFYLRIPFYMSIVICFLLLCDTSNFYIRNKNFIFWVSLLFGVLEMNREIILILGLIFVLKVFKDYSRVIVPRGVLGFVTIICALIFFLFILKPVLYLLVTGDAYDAGYQNFGEVVNWYRWLDYADRNNVDIGLVQQNDLIYGLSAIVLPYSIVDSASLIWFRDVLGNDDAGRTLGYSGVLWLSFYFKGPWIAVPWLFLFYLYTTRVSRNHVLNLIFTITLCAVSFRFFRSEWSLVLKTALWTIIYPAILAYIVSILAMRSNSIKKLIPN